MKGAAKAMRQMNQKVDVLYAHIVIFVRLAIAGYQSIFTESASPFPLFTDGSCWYAQDPARVRARERHYEREAGAATQAAYADNCHLPFLLFPRDLVFLHFFLSLCSRRRSNRPSNSLPPCTAVAAPTNRLPTARTRPPQEDMDGAMDDMFATEGEEGQVEDVISQASRPDGCRQQPAGQLPLGSWDCVPSAYCCLSSIHAVFFHFWWPCLDGHAHTNPKRVPRPWHTIVDHSPSVIW